MRATRPRVLLVCKFQNIIIIIIIIINIIIIPFYMYAIIPFVPFLLPLNSLLVPPCTIFLHAVMERDLQYLFLHPLEVFSPVTTFFSKCIQTPWYIYLLSGI